MQSQTISSTQSQSQPSEQTATSSALRFPVLRRVRELECLVEAVVASWHQSLPILLSRRWHRVGFEKPIALTNVDDVSGLPVGDSKLAVGRDISLGGISFTHTDPLPCRNIAISFALDNGVLATAVTRLTWCRFTLDGVYQSGGLFLRTVEFPDSHEFDWDRLESA